jgi:hypothetical protein
VEQLLSTDTASVANADRLVIRIVSDGSSCRGCMVPSLELRRGLAFMFDLLGVRYAV